MYPQVPKRPKVPNRTQALQCLQTVKPRWLCSEYSVLNASEIEHNLTEHAGPKDIDGEY